VSRGAASAGGRLLGGMMVDSGNHCVLLKAVPILILLLVSSNSNAAAISGNEIYEYCRTNRGFLIGFVNGFNDKSILDEQVLSGLYLHMLPKDQPPDSDIRRLHYFLGQISGYCTPEGATLDQAADIFCKYLQDTPAERQETAARLLARALKAAWPCY